MKPEIGALGSAPLLAPWSEIMEASPFGVTPRGAGVPIPLLSGPPHTFLNLFHVGCLPVLFVVTSLC